MNEQQLIIEAKIEKAKIDRVKKAVSKIQIKKMLARSRIEDILDAKRIGENIELSS